MSHHSISPHWSQYIGELEISSWLQRVYTIGGGNKSCTFVITGNSVGVSEASEMWKLFFRFLFIALIQVTKINCPWKYLFSWTFILQWNTKKCVVCWLGIIEDPSPMSREPPETSASMDHFHFSNPKIDSLSLFSNEQRTTWDQRPSVEKFPLNGSLSLFEIQKEIHCHSVWITFTVYKNKFRSIQWTSTFNIYFHFNWYHLRLHFHFHCYHYHLHFPFLGHHSQLGAPAPLPLEGKSTASEAIDRISTQNITKHFPAQYKTSEIFTQGRKDFTQNSCNIGSNR